MGSQFRPFGFKLDPDWIKLGPNGTALDPFGSHWTPWGPIGCQVRFGYLASSEVRSERTKSAFLELMTVVTAVSQVVARIAARTLHPTRAEARNDSRYTNSLKIERRRVHLPSIQTSSKPDYWDPNSINPQP